MVRYLTRWGVALLLGAPACRAPETRPWLPEGGAVAGPQTDAARVGVDILDRGGNAADAAVAIGFALAVTYPQAGNLGGGGFLVLHLEGRDFAVDCRETAPAAAHRTMYLDTDGNVIPGRSLDGHWACGVPGTVAGLGLVYETFASGNIPWKDLVLPAVRLARDGIVWVEKEESGLTARVCELRERKFDGLPAFLRYFGKDGRPLRAGERLVQPELADTLERIANEGWREFYSGRTADLIVAEMRRHGGPITTEDLAGYEAKRREPVVGSYRGCRVISMPPPSSGGLCLLQMLNGLDPFDVAALGRRTPASVHLMAEVEARAYADRAYFLGDPDFVKIPVAPLIDKDYMRERMRGFRPDRVTPSSDVVHGEVPGFSESNETTHYSILDRDGNAVSCTTTLNASYGCAVVVEGAGFLLNDEMDDFSAKPGAPNRFGLVGGEANAIRPRKRMVSSMAPTIVLTPEGRPFLVVGTPGGSTIITTVLQTIVNVIDHGMPIEEAVAAPRFHHQWKPPTIQFEPGALSDADVESLRALGHLFVARSWWSRRGYDPRDDAIRKRFGPEASLRPALFAAEASNAAALSGLAGETATHVLFAADPPEADAVRLRDDGFAARSRRWYARPGTVERGIPARGSVPHRVVVTLDPQNLPGEPQRSLLARAGFVYGTLLERVDDVDGGPGEAMLHEEGYARIAREYVTRSLGVVEAIQIDPATGRVNGSSDPRGIGTFLRTTRACGPRGL